MRNRFVHTLLGAGFLCAVSLSAAADGVKKVDAAHAPSVAGLRASAAALAQLPSGGSANELFANPNRVYPPSCLQAPLALGLYANDPYKVTTTVTLSGDLYGTAAEAAYLENDQVTVFRVPCAGGTSAMLIQIDRPTSLNGNTTTYPVIPLFGYYIDNSHVLPIRTPEDPNTFFSNSVAGVPLYESTVFVIENFYGATAVPDYDKATQIYVDNLLRNANQDSIVMAIPAYNPAAYAANALPLPISGYQSGSWYDPKHNGEGLQVEVGEISATKRYIAVFWYTYDDLGLPYWLSGTANFNVGDTSIPSLTMAYTGNGGFAGGFGATVDAAAWGKLTNINFPDCNTVKFNYASGANLPDGTPAGTGAITWTRLTQNNGLTCQ